MHAHTRRENKRRKGPPGSPPTDRVCPHRAAAAPPTTNRRAAFSTTAIDARCPPPQKPPLPFMYPRRPPSAPTPPPCPLSPTFPSPPFRNLRNRVAKPFSLLSFKTFLSTRKGPPPRSARISTNAHEDTVGMVRRCTPQKLGRAVRGAKVKTRQGRIFTQGVAKTRRRRRGQCPDARQLYFQKGKSATQGMLRRGKRHGAVGIYFHFLQHSSAPPRTRAPRSPTPQDNPRPKIARAPNRKGRLRLLAPPHVLLLGPRRSDFHCFSRFSAVLSVFYRLEPRFLAFFRRFFGVFSFAVSPSRVFDAFSTFSACLPSFSVFRRVFAHFAPFLTRFSFLLRLFARTEPPFYPFCAPRYLFTPLFERFT